MDIEKRDSKHKKGTRYESKSERQREREREKERVRDRQTER